LLEEYRDSVFASRGRHGADIWYVQEVFGYAWRSVGVWATLFAISFLIRDAIDMRMPTTDFHTRSTASTLLAAGLFLFVGLRAGSRSGSVRSAAIAGLMTAVLAAPLQLFGAALLTVLWHDPATMSAIRGSGGLTEVFTMPFFTIFPSVVFSALGGILGARVSYLRRG
jgi:hypothetical protein